jgi:hypothetical protein
LPEWRYRTPQEMIDQYVAMAERWLTGENHKISDSNLVHCYFVTTNLKWRHPGLNLRPLDKKATLKRLSYVKTYSKLCYIGLAVAEIAQSIYRLATSRTAEGSEFESRQEQDYFRLHVAQTGSGAHPAFYLMCTWGSFPGGTAAGAWRWPLSSNWCRSQEYVDLYIHSPIRLHGVVLN